jgi:hypothetical protein
MKVSYRSVAFAGIVTIVVMTVITIVGEISRPLMGFMHSLSGHHWVTKNIFSVILFLVLLAVASRSPSEQKSSPKGLMWTAVTAVACSIALLAFFVMDFLKH